MKMAKPKYKIGDVVVKKFINKQILISYAEFSEEWTYYAFVSSVLPMGHMLSSELTAIKESEILYKL